MLFFDKTLVTNERHKNTYGKWWTEVCNARQYADAEEARIMQVNEAAILPADAYREMDNITKELMRGDGGSTFMEDLMPLAKAVNIGKTIAVYRAASDAGAVVRSVSGQVGTPSDKTDYTYGKTPIPVFSSSYHRNFREWEAFQYEGFDALYDDQRNILFNLRKSIADYVLNGDSNVVVDGTVGTGIRNNPASKAINLGSAAGGANIDLATATPAQVLDFINGPLAAALDANFILPEINIYVSAEIMRNWEKPLSSPEGYKAGTLREAIEQNSRIGRIKRTFELTGNQFVAFVPSATYIRPIIGMPVSTVALPRQHPRANYVFDVWSAMGLEIRADYRGHSGVFYSTVVN